MFKPESWQSHDEYRTIITTKIYDTRYDISYSYHTSIIQKNACLYNKIHIKFLPPFRSVLLPVGYPSDSLMSAFVV